MQEINTGRRLSSRVGREEHPVEEISVSLCWKYVVCVREKG